MSASSPKRDSPPASGPAAHLCLVSRQLHAELADPLFAELIRHCATSGFALMPDRRSADRRLAERRTSANAPGDDAPERRRVRSVRGRRVAERRAALVDVLAPELPPELDPHRGALRFVERRDPAPQALADAETMRLVVSLQAGDESAFAQLHDRHAAPLFSFLRGMLADHHEAEDAAQEVWARVLARLFEFEVREAPFRVWLFRVARNWAIDHLEKHARSYPEDPQALVRRQEQALSPADLDFFDPYDSTDPALRRALRLIPVDQRQVLVLRYVADLTVAEVAEVIGRTPKAVKHLQARGLASARERLEPLQPRTRSPERREPRLNLTRQGHAPRVTTARRLALAWTL